MWLVKEKNRAKGSHFYSRTVIIIQSRFCLISASQNHSTEGLRFHPCTSTSTDYLLRVLNITGYEECFSFFNLIKHAFLLTGN